jgi:predicted membrane protein
MILLQLSIYIYIYIQFLLQCHWFAFNWNHHHLSLKLLYNSTQVISTASCSCCTYNNRWSHKTDNQLWYSLTIDTLIMGVKSSKHNIIKLEHCLQFISTILNTLYVKFFYTNNKKMNFYNGNIFQIGSLRVQEVNIILMAVLVGLQKSNFLCGKSLYAGNVVLNYM